MMSTEVASTAPCMISTEAEPDGRAPSEPPAPVELWRHHTDYSSEWNVYEQPAPGPAQ